MNALRSPSPEEWISARVARVRAESTSVKSLVLVDPDEGPLPVWEPGFHIDVEIAGGLIRQYSQCGDPQDSTSYTITVLRETVSRGGLAFL